MTPLKNLQLLAMAYNLAQHLAIVFNLLQNVPKQSPQHQRYVSQLLSLITQHLDPQRKPQTTPHICPLAYYPARTSAFKHIPIHIVFDPFLLWLELSFSTKFRALFLGGMSHKWMVQNT